MGDEKNHDGPPASFLKTQVVDTDPRSTVRRGVLLVSSGLDAGRVLRLPNRPLVTFGRAPECDFPFDDASLSREHARLAVAMGEYVIKDADSTNGSFVNDARITTAKRLNDGDRIQLGSNLVLRFSLVDDAELEALERVYNAAIKDGLTGVYNRKHLEERLDAEIAFANRQGTALSVAIFDVDHFKKVNDTYGHLGGDQVLKTVAGTLAATLRVEDVLARYGGEEFVVVARGLDVAHGVALADRARALLASTKMEFEGKTFQVTTSAGVASLACCPKADKPTLLGLADSRLYRAKQAGRNRVVGP
ncbi:MAG TPA: GGDEF domain-containing protein [Polyangia bacterium]|jgi:diguanylate cyclase (GGDEF)-like protein|nr:GGDEF domain-containing protein [Polyangia bacterium]